MENQDKKRKEYYLNEDMKVDDGEMHNKNVINCAVEDL